MKFPRLKAESDQLLHLDLLRFVACIFVVIHHMRLYFYPHEVRADVAASMISWEAIIEQFFAISGFVIALVYSERVGTWPEYRKYMKRRAARVYPLHIAMMAATAMVLAAGLALGMSANTEFDLSATCTASTAVLLQTYGGCTGSPLNYPNWTVSVEMTLYAIFPLIVMLRRHMLLFAALASAMVFLVYRHSPAGMGGAAPLLRGTVAFAFGAGLFYGRDLLNVVPFPRLLLSVLGIVYAAALLAGATTTVAVPLGYAVFVAAVAADQSRKASSWVAGLSGCAQLTYSIYMIHALVIMVVMGGIGERLLHLTPSGMLAAATAAMTLVLAFSYASYFWLETPARRWLGDLGRNARRAPMSVQGPGPATGIGGKMRNW